MSEGKEDGMFQTFYSNRMSSSQKRFCRSGRTLVIACCYCPMCMQMLNLNVKLQNQTITIMFLPAIFNPVLKQQNNLLKAINRSDNLPSQSAIINLMSVQIEKLLSNIRKVQVASPQQQLTSYEVLQWKYGTIIFTNSKPTEHFLRTVLPTNSTHHLFLTTYPFQQSPTFPSLWLQSVEQNKSLDSVEKITEFFIENNANRNSHLIIQGGGLLMDLGGFAASLYMRGLKNVTLMPTTFLGMVDATVGGKTAVNYSNTKNLLGTIRNPNHIIIHPHFLSTQTQREFFNGIVQTIKMAITYDKQFFQYLQTVDFKSLRKPQNSHVLLNIIKRSLMIKIMVVEKDLTEQNERKWLNFGHTIGHGIELDETNTLLHGQCVAIGMVKALEIALDKNIISPQRQSILQRLKKLFKKLNLSCQIPESVNIEKVLERMLKDKKMTEQNKENVDFVLIEDVGKRCEKVTKVTVKELRKYLGNGVQVKYPVEKELIQINHLFPFPSSKSISLRYLFISCLAIYQNFTQQKSSSQPSTKLPRIKLTNFLTSEDTQKMIYSLKELGFVFNINTQTREVIIQGYQERAQGELDVGNSGITARFILPLCFLIKGKWKINCHKRMEERPNAEIFHLCAEQFQGNINYLNRNLCFPVQINSTGKSLPNKPLVVEGKQSSQFISSALINWAFIDSYRQIRFKSGSSSDQNIVSESYLHMTFKCLEQFGIRTTLNKKLKKIEIDSSQITLPSVIHVQNDLSTFSYPFTLYEMHGIANEQIKAEDYMQGDTLFYQYIGNLKRKVERHQKVIRFDFNNCTDTFMTFLVFCCSDSVLNSGVQKILIQNISNQRVKESNRIDLTIRNLKKVGMLVEEYENHVELIARPLNHLHFESQDQIIFQTHEDHRLAMSFGILSTLLSKKYPHIKFIIDSKKAVEKTFPEFWKYLSASGIDLNYISVQDFRQQDMNLVKKQTTYHTTTNINTDILKNSIFIVGNRGSGKTTIGKNVAGQLGLGFLDLDDLIVEQIKSSFRLPSIEKLIQLQGWQQFRTIQSQVLQRTLSTLRYSSHLPFIISTGGGILQRQLNRAAFKRQKANIFYLQRPFSQLKAFQSQHRPILSDFEKISKQREPQYEDIASQIVTFAEWREQEWERKFTVDAVRKFIGKEKSMPEGYILCLGEQIINPNQSLTQQQMQQPHTYQIRIDKLLSNNKRSLKQVRQIISNWRVHNMSKNLLLTLRTKAELGEFQAHNEIGYQEMMKKVSKIPCDFLDHEVRYETRFQYNYNKFVRSYHGSDQNVIRKLLSYQHGFKKFCFMKDLTKTTMQKPQNLCEAYKSMFSKGICIDLSNPLTRFNTKYQMIIPEKSSTELSTTGIMTLSQMKHMKKILRLL